MNDTAALLATFQAAALSVGPVVLDLYHNQPAVKIKADQTPVTEADERAERMILQRLAADAHGIPVIAEEEVARGTLRKIGSRFILVDPLDGTREFIAQRPEFTVNIALVEKGEPTLGFVYAPALAVAYAGSRDGAWRLQIGPDFDVLECLQIAVRPAPASPVALSSRSHESRQTVEYLEQHGIREIRRLGSSLKFCLVAEGSADVYPRFGCTMEWDTAAGDAVLRAAGGCTRTLDGQPLVYGKTGVANEADFANPDFLATGS